MKGTFKMFFFSFLCVTLSGTTVNFPWYIHGKEEHVNTDTGNLLRIDIFSFLSSCF